MDFEDQLKALVYFHLEEQTSGRHLLQVLEEDDFASHAIAPPEGIKKSSFFEATAIMSPGETSVMDRYYQCHKNFDLWQRDKKQFICRICEGSNKTLIKQNNIKSDSDVFYDAVVLLGSKGIKRVNGSNSCRFYYLSSPRYLLP